jgi:hypothetical protein
MTGVASADYDDKVTNLIDLTFNKILELKNSASLKKAIFDPAINTKQLYRSNLDPTQTQYD